MSRDADDVGVTDADPDDPPGGVILLPLVEAEGSPQVLRLAGWLAAAAGTDLVVLASATYPTQTPLERAASDARERYGPVVDDLVAAAAVPARGVVRVGHAHEAIVDTAIDEHRVRTLVVEDLVDPLSPDRSTVPRLVRRADCDSVVVSRAAGLTGLDSLLVPVAAGPHSGLAVDVARVVATATDATVTLLHVLDPSADDRARERADDLLAGATERLDDSVDAERRLVVDEAVAGTIVDAAAEFDASVIGAPRRNRLRRFVYGSTTDAVREDARLPVLTVRCGPDGDGSRGLLGDAIVDAEERPTLPVRLSPETVAELEGLDVGDVAALREYVRDRLREGRLVEAVTEEVGDDVVSLEPHEGYVAVTLEHGRAGDGEDRPGDRYLYHVVPEPRDDGSEHLHWTFIGRVEP